ncbi:hypothetical protein SAMN05428944_0359 [Streptomyces sp. 1222.5]|uniref:hypothetical protein n=1 Tax=unclassified Streptomyces TaxID=2593676 RepID=UPI000896975D|nr:MULTISPECIES: hypothetical protein [unclassified Streptomyces]PKW12381.1 hypothetical protein BX260_7737 [Streptomyces sp. 5112.2]SEB57335.1 hypothetical protein SAMN05428944_0359 [Streptomyces sp. 1222.5]
MESRKRAEVTGLGTLQPGTRQRAQLRFRFADIAWTALCFVLAVWAVASSVGAVRGMTAWAYCAVAWILLAVACAMLLTTVRARKRI